MIRRLLLLAAAVAGIVGAAFFPLPLVAQPQSVTVTGTVTVGSITAGNNNIGDVDVASSALPTGASTLAEQQTQSTSLSTIAGDTTDIETAIELIDNAAGITPSDNFANPTGALVVYALTGCWDGSTWDRCTGTAADTELSTAAAAADNFANPTAGGVLAFNMCFDGSTWDRCLVSTATEATISSAVTAAGIGGYAIGVRRDAAATTGDTDGDNTIASYDATGHLWARIGVALPAGTNNIGDVDIVSGTVTTVSTVTTLSQLGGVALPIEDAAETAGGVGIYAMSVRRDVAASSAGTTADNATINTSDLGLVWTRSLDPCDGGEAKSVVSIDIVTATTTEIIDAVASENAHICSINLVTAGANNVALVEDDTDACASPTAGMAGGVTAAEGWNFAANGGLALGNGQGTVLKSAAQNRNVCLITSAAVQLSGTVTYVTK